MENENVLQLPLFTKSENIAEVLLDLARHAPLFDKLIVIASKGSTLPMIWTRGIEGVEAVGLASLGEHLLKERHLTAAFDDAMSGLDE